MTLWRKARRHGRGCQAQVAPNVSTKPFFLTGPEEAAGLVVRKPIMEEKRTWKVQIARYGFKAPSYSTYRALLVHDHSQPPAFLKRIVMAKKNSVAHQLRFSLTRLRWNSDTRGRQREEDTVVKLWNFSQLPYYVSGRLKITCFQSCLKTRPKAGIKIA